MIKSLFLILLLFNSIILHSQNINFKKFKECKHIYHDTCLSLNNLILDKSQYIYIYQIKDSLPYDDSLLCEEGIGFNNLSYLFISWCKWKNKMNDTLTLQYIDYKKNVYIIDSTAEYTKLKIQIIDNQSIFLLLPRTNYIKLSYPNNTKPLFLNINNRFHTKGPDILFFIEI